MTAVLPGPRRRLAAVDALADSSADPRMAARASVWLLRLAVEHALDDLWTSCAPDLVEASRRAQLLVLPRFLNPDSAWRVAEMWTVLSRVAHHHAYELTPTRAEIAAWREAVDHAVAVLEASKQEVPASAGGSPPPTIDRGLSFE